VLDEGGAYFKTHTAEAAGMLQNFIGMAGNAASSGALGATGAGGGKPSAANPHWTPQSHTNPGNNPPGPQQPGFLDTAAAKGKDTIRSVASLFGMGGDSAADDSDDNKGPTGWLNRLGWVGKAIEVVIGVIVMIGAMLMNGAKSAFNGVMNFFENMGGGHSADGTNPGKGQDEAQKDAAGLKSDIAQGQAEAGQYAATARKYMGKGVYAAEGMYNKVTGNTPNPYEPALNLSNPKDFSKVMAAMTTPLADDPSPSNNYNATDVKSGPIAAPKTPARPKGPNGALPAAAGAQ
jgi:hypothetical protein